MVNPLSAGHTAGLKNPAHDSPARGFWDNGNDPVPEVTTVTTFESIGVRPRTSAALSENGFTEPNTVQQEAIPPLLARQDCVIEAPTGSGKTLAYVVPLVERLAGHQGHGARALIVTPTRELATQVNAVIRKVDPALRTVICIGGVGYGPQTGGLRNAPDVIVGCPGRLLDLASNGLARLRDIEYLVLDEADEMLDQGFAKDVEKIISMCPALQQQRSPADGARLGDDARLGAADDHQAPVRAGARPRRQRAGPRARARRDERRQVAEDRCALTPPAPPERSRAQPDDRVSPHQARSQEARS